MRWMMIYAAMGLLLVPAFAAPEGGSLLFNGKDLAGWDVPKNNSWWTVSDGVLVGQSNAKKQGNSLYTTKSYKNFILETEVRFGDGIDSGIFLRRPEMQVQIGVSRSLKKDMTCSIYVEKKGYVAKAHDIEKLLKLNEWNAIRVKAEGAKFTVWLNGQNVLEWESTDYGGAGPIGLQIHPGVEMKVEFRNMRIQSLDVTSK